MDSEKIIGCICGMVGLFGIGYAIGASSKLKSVSDAVKQAYKSMEIDAKEKIAKELRNIDVSDLKNEVKEEAAQLVKDKLSSQMDDILDTYNANLMNVQNIYSSIAKSMSARA